MSRHCVVSGGLLCVILSGIGIASATTYNLAQLNPLPGTTVAYPRAVATVNGIPEVVGCSTSGGVYTPVMWSAGTAQSLLPYIPGGTTGFNTVLADGINQNGDIVGGVILSSTGVNNAFYLPHGAGSATILPFFSGQAGPAGATGISNGGAVVGYSANSTYFDGGSQSIQPCPNAFVWTAGGGIVDLGVPGTPSVANAISADGNVIVGEIGMPYGSLTPQEGQLAVWTKSGSTWTLSTPVPLTTYNQTTGLAVNDNYDIAGGCFNYKLGDLPTTTRNAMTVKHDGTIANLGDEGHASAYLTGINDSGMVIGTDLSVAFVNFTGAAGNNQLLTSVLAAGQGAGWYFYNAWGCDNAGDIVGLGKVGGSYYGYLLTPSLLPGDANGDGVVDIADLSIVLANYDKSGMGWNQGDFDGNGTVDIADLSKILANYDKSLGAAATGLNVVPEPGMLTLVTVGLVGLSVYSWRKRRKRT
jgi:probable HAF family extracellular repeat protein